MNFGLDGYTGVAPASCIDPIDDELYTQVETKKGLCKCASSNLALFPYKSNEKVDKKELLKKSLEKSKIGLISLSEEIFLLNKRYQNSDPGPKCDAMKRFDDAAKCNGKKNTILSIAERKEKAEILKRQLYIDSVSDGHRAYPPPNSNYRDEKSLFDRNELNSVLATSNDNKSCMQNKGVTQGFISDMQNTMLENQFEILRSIIESNTNNLDKSGSLEEFIEKMDKNVVRSDKEVRQAEQLRKFSIEVRSNPIYSNLLKSKSFFKNFMDKSNEPIGSLVERFKESKEFESELISNLQKKCDAVFKSYEKSFCATHDEPILPIDNVEDTKESLLEGKFGDQDKVENIMETSFFLSDNYCKFPENTKSNLSEVSKIVEPAISPFVKDSSTFKNATMRLFENTTFKIGNKLCKHLPPEINKLEEAMKLNKCGENPLSPDCRLFAAANIALGPVLEAREKQVSDKVKLAAKERGITDKTQIAKMVKDAVSQIDSKEIMNAFSEYNNVPKGKSTLLNRFLGVKTPKTQIVAGKNQKNSSKSEVSTPEDVEQGNESAGNFSGASIGSSSARTVDYQSTLPQNKYAKEARQKTSDSLDDFHREIARRVMNVKDSRRSGPPTKSIATRAKGKTATQKLFDALPSPSINDNITSNSTTLASNSLTEIDSNDSEGNVGKTSVDYNSNNNIKSAVGTETIIDEDNKALADKHRANEASRLAELNKGKIPPSPFSKDLEKVTGKGKVASKGTFGTRGPGARYGSGKDSFLAGGASSSMPINPDEFLPDINQLIDGVYLEKQRGLEGQNTEHAKYLLELLGGKTKTVTLKNKENEKHEVQIIRKGKNLKLVPLGNMADEKYNSFVSKIENTIIRYNNVDYNKDFNGLLKRLKSAVESETGVPEPEKSTVRFDQFVER